MIFPALIFFLFFLFAEPDPLRSGEDLAGLYSLRASLGIRASAWPRKTDPCSNWTGVSCQSGRVISLNLTGLHRTRLGRLSPRFAIDGVRNLTALERFIAAGFPLPGPIPDWLGTSFSPTFSVLILNSAAITGNIPYSLGGAAGLLVLSLSVNSITGNIPSTLGALAKLSVLDLSWNLLSNSIPPDFSGLRNLSRLDLSSNYLSGAIPPSLGLLSRLKTLVLAGNSLGGVIPAQLGDLSKLESFDLSSNSLSGALPQELFSAASNLRLINLSRNYFDGMLPHSAWLLSGLELFDASSNNLTGVFPKSVPGNASAAAQVFNISSNLYYGVLSSEMGLFFRRFSAVDLSNNYLVGSEPFGIMGDKNALLGSNCFSGVANQRSSAACKIFYNKNNRYDFSVPPDLLYPGSLKSKKNSRSWKYILAGILGGSVALMAAFLMVLLCLKIWRNRAAAIGGETPKDPEICAISKHLVSSSGMIGESFTYEQLVKATSDFGSTNLIKRGHSGSLYHGMLKENVSIVVKRVDALTELDLFAKYTNVRLVPLLGHCLEKENDKFLIYKFMPHGDLSMALHWAPRLAQEELQPLDWITRLKIAVGVVEALCFLHHECAPPLVHRDIQSSSILLDEKFEVRLGSLREVCPQEGDSHSNMIANILRRSQTPLQQHESSENGYPSRPATCAYDIYCLGKVLLELITGVSSSDDDCIEAEWMDQTLSHIDISDRDLILKIVDPTLVVDDGLLEEVWAMAVMASCCLNPKPSRRPLARQLLKALQNPLRVVRDDSFSGSDPLRSSSFYSWPAAFLTGRHHSSNPQMGLNARPQGSLGDHSSSRSRASKEVFPEPNGGMSGEARA